MYFTNHQPPCFIDLSSHKPWYSNNCIHIFILTFYNCYCQEIDIFKSSHPIKSWTTRSTCTSMLLLRIQYYVRQWSVEFLHLDIPLPGGSWVVSSDQSSKGLSNDWFILSCFLVLVSFSMRVQYLIWKYTYDVLFSSQHTRYAMCTRSTYSAPEIQNDTWLKEPIDLMENEDELSIEHQMMTGECLVVGGIWYRTYRYK